VKASVVLYLLGFFILLKIGEITNE